MSKTIHLILGLAAISFLLALGILAYSISNAGSALDSLILNGNLKPDLLAGISSQIQFSLQLAGIFAGAIILFMVLLAIWMKRLFFNDLGNEPSEIKGLTMLLSEGNLELSGPKNKIPSGIAGNIIRFSEKLKNLISDALGSTSKIQQKNIEVSGLIYNVSEHSDEANQLGEKAVRQLDQLNANIVNVSTSVEQTQSNISAISSTAEALSSNLNTVAAASEQAVANMAGISDSASYISKEVNQIALGVEDFTETLKDISEKIQIGSEASSGARGNAMNNLQVMEKLHAKTTQVDRVIKMINSIASQTNMLALNATIEAASAGEAGKGFSVVAEEVKSLAGQTAQANREVEKEITEIQLSTQEVASRIKKVGAKISEIDDINTYIQTAVEGQNRAALEIKEKIETIVASTDNSALNVKEALAGLKEINTATAEASQGASKTAQASIRGAAGASSINRSSEELETLFRAFRGDIENLADIIINLNQEAEAAKDQSSTGNEELEKLIQQLSFFKFREKITD